MNNILLTLEQMKRLCTKRLLAYKNRLMKYTEIPNWDNDGNMICKSHPVWQEAYANIKKLLATREHIIK